MPQDVWGQIYHRTSGTNMPQDVGRQIYHRTSFARGQGDACHVTAIIPLCHQRRRGSSLFRRTRTRRQVDAHMVSHWRFGSTWKTRTMVLLLWFVLDLLSDICHWRPSETRTDLMDCSRWITHATNSMQQKTSSAQLDCCLLGSLPDGFASTMIFSDGSKWCNLHMPGCTTITLKSSMVHSFHGALSGKLQSRP